MSRLLGKLARREELRVTRADALGTVGSMPGSRRPEKNFSRAASTLEFDEVSGPLGLHHVRQVREKPSRCFGKVALGEALCADPLLLARLALDATFEGLPFEGALFLDTETSGLGGGTGNRAFLVGLCWFDKDAGDFVLEQLFLRDIDEEAALLERVRERVEAAAFIVSYNGKSFDVPLLRTRMLLARVGPFPERPHLDLLHIARRVHGRRGWRMSLGVVEQQVLEFERGPDVGGEEVAMRYAHYLWSGDDSCLQDVVKHNCFDVWSLVVLLGYYGRTPEPETRGATAGAAPELSAMARVLSRAGDLEWATRLADGAVRCAGEQPARLDGARGAGLLGKEAANFSADARDALWTRATIAKSRGDKASAMADFARLVLRADDPDARLELAKFYEHFTHEPEQALALVRQGTGENAECRERREERLIRKVERMRR